MRSMTSSPTISVKNRRVDGGQLLVGEFAPLDERDIRELGAQRVGLAGGKRSRSQMVNDMPRLRRT